MKAILRRRFGPPEELQLAEIPRPEPAAGEVLVRVRASSVNAFDRGFVRGTPLLGRLMMGLLLPSTPRIGAALAGVVEVVGAGVTRFKSGDEVYGTGLGAYAEFVCSRERKLAPKPRNLSFEQAAAVPIAAITAFNGLHERIPPARTVLITGAAGGVGSFAVQLAKLLGAEVTGVCHSQALDFVRSLGADHVIDYAASDYTHGAARYDLLFDVSGEKPLSACRRLLNQGGVYLLVGSPPGYWVAPIDKALVTLARSWFSRGTLGVMLARSSSDELVALKDLIEAGKITPAIDSAYPGRGAGRAPSLRSGPPPRQGRDQHRRQLMARDSALGL